MRDTERPADSLWLIAHDSATGRPRLGRRLLGLGLAAALLGELVVLDLVQVQDDLVYPQALRPFLRRKRHYSPWVVGTCGRSYEVLAPEDEQRSCPDCLTPGVEWVPEDLQREVWELVVQERPARSVRDWLSVLSDDAPWEVARRLEADGWLSARSYRSVLRLGRRRTRWLPVEFVAAEMPRQGVRRIAQGRAIPDDHQRLVCGLIEAVGLTDTVLDGLDDGAWREVASWGRGLSAPLQQLLRHAKACADTAVMTHAG